MLTSSPHTALDFHLPFFTARHGSPQVIIVYVRKTKEMYRSVRRYKPKKPKPKQNPKKHTLVKKSEQL